MLDIFSSETQEPTGFVRVAAATPVTHVGNCPKNAEQIIDLMANGVNNIHIYTMNKPDVAHRIMEGLSAIINE